MDYTTDIIYNRIKHACIDKRLSIIALCRAAGANRNAVADIGNGHIPSSIQLARFADVLGVSVDYLLGRTNNPDVNR